MNSARAALGGLAVLLLAGPPAVPQGNDSGTIAGQSASGDGARRGAVAHVGAGTTDAATTGHSGPKPTSSGTPGEVKVPPLPSASQCEDYKGTPAHEGCLGIVLRQERKAP